MSIGASLPSHPLILPLAFWLLAPTLFITLLPCHKATSASLPHYTVFLATLYTRLDQNTQLMGEGKESRRQWCKFMAVDRRG